MSACANSENGPRLGTIAAAVHRARKNRVCLPKKVSAPLDLAWSAKKRNPTCSSGATNRTGGPTPGWAWRPPSPDSEGGTHESFWHSEFVCNHGLGACAPFGHRPRPAKVSQRANRGKLDLCLGRYRRPGRQKDFDVRPQSSRPHDIRERRALCFARRAQ